MVYTEVFQNLDEIECNIQTQNTIVRYFVVIKKY